MRSRLPTCWATAAVFISCEWPEVIANSPSMAIIFRLSGAPTMSQKAALPAEVAMPIPDGPPLTSLVRSVVSECPARDLMPLMAACDMSGWSTRSLSWRIVSRAPLPRLNPSASMDSIEVSGSAK